MFDTCNECGDESGVLYCWDGVARCHSCWSEFRDLFDDADEPF